MIQVTVDFILFCCVVRQDWCESMVKRLNAKTWKVGLGNKIPEE